jgi:hypothetical protein
MSAVAPYSAVILQTLMVLQMCMKVIAMVLA